MRFLERLPRSSDSAIIQFKPQLQISCLMPEHKRMVVYQGSTIDEFGIPLTLWTSQIAVFHGVPKTAAGAHANMNHRYLVHAVKPGDKPNQIFGQSFNLGNTSHEEAICWGSNPFPSDLRHAVNQYFLSSFAGIHDYNEAVMSDVDKESLLIFVNNILDWAAKEAKAGIDAYVKKLAGKAYSTPTVMSMLWCAAYAVDSALVREREMDVVRYLLEQAKELLKKLKNDIYQTITFPLSEKDLAFIDGIADQTNSDKYVNGSKCGVALLMAALKPRRPVSQVVGYAPKWGGVQDISKFVMGEEYIGLKGPIDSIYMSDEAQDIELAGRSFLSNQVVKEKNLLRKSGDVPVAIGKADLVDGKYRITLIPSGQVVIAKPNDVEQARPQDKEKMYRGYTKDGAW